MLLFLSFINDALYDGLPFALVCVSFVVTAKYIRFPDVTCSGSFVLGAAVAATAIVRGGINPVVAMALAGLAGAMAGALTGFFYTALRLDRLLAGILSAFVLYSVNLLLLAPTLAYNDQATVLSPFEARDRLIVGSNESWHPWVIVLLGAIVLFTKLALDRFLDSEVGLAMRCLEDEQSGEYALERYGLKPDRLKVMALCIGNAVVGVAGALVSFKEGAANAQRGFDVLITALVAFLLGTQMLSFMQRLSASGRVVWVPRFRVTSCAICGALTYFALMTLSQRLNIASEFTKIVLVALVALSAASPGSVLRTYVRKEKHQSVPLSGDALLTVQGLDFKYPSADNESLIDLSFTVNSSEVVQLAGGNGVGKTTALRLIAGFLDAQRNGRILFRGADLTRDRHERLTQIAYVDQNADRGVVGCLNTEENLALASVGSRPSLWRRALSIKTLDHVRNVLERGAFVLDAPWRLASQLSGGQRQVLNLLTLLARKEVPEVILLDEPTNNLDIGNTERCGKIIETLHNDGAAIVIVSHTPVAGVPINRIVALHGNDTEGAVLTV